MNREAVIALVLERLARWKRLALSDLDSMLKPTDRLLVTRPLLRGMTADGLLEAQIVGDEPVLTITERGTAWLADYQAGSAAP
ncbi:MAG: hypothetical protein U0821_03345 [Chloroflexota bacterium]